MAAASRRRCYTDYYCLLTIALHSAFRRTLKKQPYYSIVTVVTVHSLPRPLVASSFFSFRVRLSWQSRDLHRGRSLVVPETNTTDLQKP